MEKVFSFVRDNTRSYVALEAQSKLQYIKWEVLDIEIHLRCGLILELVFVRFQDRDIFCFVKRCWLKWIALKVTSSSTYYCMKKCINSKTCEWIPSFVNSPRPCTWKGYVIKRNGVKDKKCVPEQTYILT